RARYLNVVLAAQAEASDQRLVTSCARPLEVVQQSPPLADHDQQPAARVKVFFVGRQMTGQVADALAQDRDLHLGRSRVADLGAVFGNERLLALGSDRHRSSSLRD